jgi:hypothetical protein
MPTQSSTLAIVSLIMGILSYFGFPLVGAVVAVITGHLAKKEIRESLGRLTGNEMATIGLVLGYAHLIMSFVAFCCALILVLLAMAGAIGVPLLCWPFSQNGYTY